MRNKWLLGVFVFHTLFKPGDYFRILVWTATENYMLENINDQTVICRIAIFKPRQTKKFIWYWFVHFCVEATKKTISDKSDYKAWLILNTAWYGHAIKWRYWSRVEADFWQIQELSWLWSGHLVDNRMLPKLHCAAWTAFDKILLLWQTNPSLQLLFFTFICNLSRNGTCHCLHFAKCPDIAISDQDWKGSSF